MISLLRKALDLLDEQGQEEVFQFLISQQNENGGFKDRGGRSDLYYSLFGMLSLEAWGMGQRVKKSDQSQYSVTIESERQNFEFEKKLKHFIA